MDSTPVEHVDRTGFLEPHSRVLPDGGDRHFFIDGRDVPNFLNMMLTESANTMPTVGRRMPWFPIGPNERYEIQIVIRPSHVSDQLRGDSVDCYEPRRMLDVQFCERLTEHLLAVDPIVKSNDRPQPFSRKSGILSALRNLGRMRAPAASNETIEPEPDGRQVPVSAHLRRVDIASGKATPVSSYFSLLHKMR